MGAKSKKCKNITPNPDMESYYYKFSKENPRSPYNAIRSTRYAYNNSTVFSFRLLQLERIAKLIELLDTKLHESYLVGQQLHKILEQVCGDSQVLEMPDRSGEVLSRGIFVRKDGWMYSTDVVSNKPGTNNTMQQQHIADHIKISKLLQTKSNRQWVLHRRNNRIRAILSVLVEHYATEQCCQNSTITTGIHFLPIYNGKGATYVVKVNTNYGYDGQVTHAPVIEIIDVYGAPVNTKTVPVPTVVIPTDNSYSRSQCTQTIPEELPEWFRCRR